MRILYLTHQYPPAVGGSEKYIADLASQMAARGHKVDVFTSRSTDYHTWKTELGPYERMDQVDVYRFHSIMRRGYTWRLLHYGMDRYRRTGSRWYEPFIFAGNGPFCPGMFVALLSRLHRYDLVHLNCLVYSHSAYGYLAARLRGTPVVITPHVHVDQDVTYGIGYQLGVLRGSDHVIASTDGEREFLVGLGLEPTCVTTSGIGVDSALYPLLDSMTCRHRLALPQDAFVISFLGRQVQYKGLDTVLEAFVILRQHYPHLYLLVAGPETDYSRRLFARYAGQPGLLNRGFVPDDVRLDILNACDCLVLPSEGEAFGIVFLEAWAVGKPVIGAHTASVSTVIADGQDGWLVPVKDPAAVATALERWIRSPLLAKGMGQRGREKILTRYTWARVADIIERVYATVLDTACAVDRGN